MQKTAIEEKGKLAFENCQNIIVLKNNIGKNLLRLAFLLNANHDNQYYKVLGYDTWESFLAIPEISISRFFAYKLIQVHLIWVKQFNVSPAKLDIDIEKLYMAGTMATEKNYKEMLEKAKQLSRSDLSEEIREAKGDQKEKAYIPEKKSYIVTCPKCGCKFEYFI